MSKWLDFEKMIAQIYQTLSPNATVIHNDAILGVESGIERQVDVSIRFREAGCDFLVIVQAKTNSRPLDVNTVGEFASVIKDVRASKGVLICNAGFTKAAQTFAKSIGMDLCSAHDAESKDWRTTLRIPIIWIRLQPYVQFSALMELKAGDSVGVNIGEWKFRYQDNREEFSVLDIFVEQWNENKLSKESNETHTIALGNDEYQFFAEKGWRNATDLKLTYIVNRHFLRNELETSEFTGIRNQLTGYIEIAKLNIIIPPRLPVHGWVELSKEEEDFVSDDNVIVSVEDPIILNPPSGQQTLSVQEIL
ncbi:MAG: restriction endonuclease [Anaerolineae bacterium]|nr:restriction endonuclease [Anaerolineae bacterium]